MGFLEPVTEQLNFRVQGLILFAHYLYVALNFLLLLGPIQLTSFAEIQRARGTN